MKKLIKVSCFAFLLVVLLINIGNTFQAKWNDMGDRIANFYKMETNPEVVFIGSSHLFCSINPVLLFHEYGLTSYDFASAGQDLSLSNLYVKETIRTKKPKVIVLESLGLSRGILSETNHRKGLDSLPLTKNKIKEILYVFNRNEKYNQKQNYDSLLSYIFPVIRYHDRWDKINTSDFMDDDPTNVSKFYGYLSRYQTVEADFSNFNQPFDIQEELLEENKILFDEIVQLCQENNIQLLLIKSPSPMWRQDCHEIVAAWAEEYALPFIDYNYLMKKLDITAAKDFFDKTSHLNDLGATKMTMHLGEYLKENYDLTDYRGNSDYADYELGWTIYQQDKNTYFMSLEKDFTNYLKYLDNPNYTIYMTVRDTIGGLKHPELTEKLIAIGLDEDIHHNNRWSYQAIVKAGDIYYEQFAEEMLLYKDEIDGNKIELISAGYEHGNRGSIKINGTEYFVNHRGIGIVVYDNVLGKVVDSVTFDLHAGGKAYRN